MPVVTPEAVQHTRNVRPSPAAQAGIYAIIAFLGISRLWVEGYAFGIADHSWQVPMVRGFARGEFLKDYIFDPPLKLSFFFPMMGYVARAFSIEHAYLAVYVLASVATTIAIYLLASRMLQSRPAAFLAVVLLLVGKDVAAGARTWDALLLPRVAAMPLLLLSWWLLLEERPVKAGFAMGLAFALHPLTGIYGAVIAAAAMAANGGWYRTAWRFAAGMAVPAAFTLYYVLPSPAPMWHAPEEWYIVMLARNIHHIASTNLVVFAGLLAYALWAAYWLKGAGGQSKLLLAATGASAVLFMYVGAAEIGGRLAHLADPRIALLHPPLFATMQPLRISGPLGVLVLIATGGVLWRAMQKGFVARVTAVGALGALSFGHYVVGAAFLAASLASQDKSWPLRTAAVTLAVAALGYTLAYEKTLVILVLGTVAAAILVTRATRTRMEAAAATLVTVIVLIGITGPRWAAAGARRAFGEQAVLDSPAYLPRISTELAPDKALQEAAAWVSGHTANDDTVIVPPGWESFRVAADRPVFGTYKDGTLAFFNARLAGEWLKRMEALNVPLDEESGSRLGADSRTLSQRLDARRVIAAADCCPARYIVRYAQDLPGFELAYAGKYVSIYRIPTSEK